MALVEREHHSSEKLINKFFYQLNGELMLRQSEKTGDYGPAESQDDSGDVFADVAYRVPHFLIEHVFPPVREKLWQAHLTAIADNLKRTRNIPTPA